MGLPFKMGKVIGIGSFHQALFSPTGKGTKEQQHKSYGKDSFHSILLFLL